MQIVYMCTFVILFSNFFYKTYHHRPQKQHIKAASHLKGGGEMSNGFASPVNVVSNEQALKKDDWLSKTELEIVLICAKTTAEDCEI